MAKNAPETPTFPINCVFSALRASPWLTQSVLIWDWSYKSRNDDDDQLIRAHGKIATDFDHDGEGWHEILAIVGSHNGDQITGLVPAGQSIPGNDPYEGDNRIRSIFSREDKAQLSKNGFQYKLEDGSYANVFFGSFFDPPSYVEFHSRPPFPDGAIAPNTEVPIGFIAIPDLC